MTVVVRSKKKIYLQNRLLKRIQIFFPLPFYIHSKNQNVSERALQHQKDDSKGQRFRSTFFHPNSSRRHEEMWIVSSKSRLIPRRFSLIELTDLFSFAPSHVYQLPYQTVELHLSKLQRSLLLSEMFSIRTSQSLFFSLRSEISKGKCRSRSDRSR